MSAPTCILCGADESQGPLDPRRCDVEGAVRCAEARKRTRDHGRDVGPLARVEAGR
ncbi:MAG: hypothetical protein WC211_00700 [Dehalococcoidia bacterium]